MSDNFERGRLLLNQDRHAEAEKYLRLAITDDPNFSPPHALLATCLIHLNKIDQAMESAETAVSLDPDLDYAHYVKASVHFHADEYASAIQSIETALKLDPDDAENHGMKALILNTMGKWQEALSAADEGLRQDPENNHCLNCRARALSAMGRAKESHATIDSSLQNNPEDALSHANKGWSYLHEDKPAQAMIHFREALRLNPTSEYARSGMIDAMKARYLVYRVILKFFFQLAKLDAKARWILMILLFVVSRYIRSSIADAGYPLLASIVGMSFFAFFILTCISDSLFNFALLFNKFGRSILSTLQRAGAITITSVLAIGVPMFIFGNATHWPLAMTTGLFFIVITVPLDGCFEKTGTRKWAVWISTAVCIVLGITCLILFLTGSTLFTKASLAMLIAIMVAMLIAT